MFETDGELIPSRLNEDPPVFRGCSIQEMAMIAFLSLVLCVPVSVIVLSTMGYAMVGIGMGFLASIGLTVVFATMLQRMKRGRPAGYYQLQIRLALDRYGIYRLNVTKRSGHWDIGRTAKNVNVKVQK